MVVEVVPEGLYTLAAVLEYGADRADRSAAAVPDGSGPGAVGPAVPAFCEAVRTAGTCLAGELRWLGGAVAGAADSWLGLDGSMLPVRGAGVPR
jgi:hypothetical protein